MQEKLRIGILGVGGVGGYFGGLLAEKYNDDEEVEVILIARPATAAIIREKGLELVKAEGERTIHPQFVTTNSNVPGVLDVLICTTKSYDLEEAILPLRSSINKDTLILPLLNGVNARDMIRAWFPDNEVIDGCVYINARRTAPGVIRKTGVIEKFYFGAVGNSRHDLARLQQIFQDANIDSILSDHIETDIWDKFIFITVLATTTSYYNERIHGVLANPDQKKTLLALLQEAIDVASAQKIAIGGDILDRTMEKFAKLPPDAMSSMHSDFLGGGKTEYLSLTKYIADLGDKLGIDTPVYDMIVADFETRNS